MLNVLSVVLWSSLAMVIYAYLVYPVLICLCARLFGRSLEAPLIADEQAPFVSILISALNEEEVIGERLQNALALDYPAERFEIVVASDGSVDGTAEIVQSFANRFPERVQLIDFPQRRGKATVLNNVLPEVRGEIVVMTDANTYFDRSALRNLTRWFQDPDVGAVCGKLILQDAVTGRNADGLYWRYETLIKRCEGRLGALLGANGAIYALRRTKFVPIPSDTILDDFMIPLSMTLQHGAKILYDAEAIATEETPASVGDEFRRRSRIGAGGYQSLIRLRKLLLPRYGWTCFAFLSHKVLRWSCPLFLLLALATNIALVGQTPFQYLLAIQCAFYLTALIGLILPGNSIAIRLIRLTSMFASMNLALAVGFVRWAFGWQRGTWQRTARAPATVAS
jgi:cellulose synthase/poly-beta-1,6-N-acetylglucosamine synthase-like glycosyltransferase